MQQDFTYTTEAGATITLPPFSTIPFGVIRKLRNEPEQEQVFLLVEELADPAALEQIDRLGMAEIGVLFAGWQEQAKVNLGESSASSDS